jgi:dihydroneopterin aldolase
MSDWIEIHGLEIAAHVGVPAAERAAAQQLLADVRMRPLRDFSKMPDAIEATVDYQAVADRIAAIAAARPRKLIETLADEIARALLREYAVRRIEVTLRKFILPNAEHVAVHCARERSS